MEKQTTRKASKKAPKKSSEKITEDVTEKALEEECEEAIGKTQEDSNTQTQDDAPEAESDDLSEQDVEESSDGDQDEQGDLIDAKELGRRGEQAAVRFLERKGIEILERNWTCLAGEADIIAFDDEALRFVEVKTRTDVSKGFPSEAVTKSKRQRYEKIAALYLQESDFPECRVTFDVIAILVTGSHRAFLKYHRDAFAFDVAR